MPKQQLKIIDTHTHVFPDALAPRATETLTVPNIYFPHYDGTLKGLLASMDRFGIAQSWTVPVATRASQVETINSYAATQPRDRITPFGAMHPDVENPREILATYRERGLAGFKLHPDYEEVRPTDPRMEPIWEAASDFGLIGYFHAGDDENPHTKYGNPDEFAAVLDQYPNLKLVCAHFGGLRMWDEVEEKLVGRNVWFDTAYTFGIIEPEQFLRMAKRHGYDKITFGTDGPWTDPQVSLDFLKDHAADIADCDLELLCHGAAERLLAEVNYPAA